MSRTIQTLSVHLGSDFNPRICRPLAAHPHLIITADLTLFFGHDDTEAIRNIRALKEAVLQLERQTEAEQASRRQAAQRTALSGF